MHRATKRHNVKIPITLDGHPSGMSRDVSLGGAFVQTETKPAVGTQHDVDIEVDAAIVGCVAHVVRHESDGVALQFDRCTGTFDRALLHLLGPSALDPDDLRGK